MIISKTLKKYGKSSAVLFFSIILFYNLLTMYRYHEMINTTGGEGVWSATVKDLAEYIQLNSIKPLYVAQPGYLDFTIPLLTKGEYSVIREVTGTVIWSEYLSDFLAISEGRDIYYLISIPTANDFGHRLTSALKEKGFTVTLEKMFLNRSGGVTFILYKVARGGQL